MLQTEKSDGITNFGVFNPTKTSINDMNNIANKTEKSLIVWRILNQSN